MDVGALYRQYAACCVSISRHLEPASKLAMLDIAQAWIKLAEQAEKNREVTLVYETPDVKRAEKDPDLR